MLDASPASSANTAKIGAISIAPRMSIPWKKSVQQTAENPPRKVYPMITSAAMYIAVCAGTPRTVLKSVPHALMLDAE